MCLFKLVLTLTVFTQFYTYADLCLDDINKLIKAPFNLSRVITAMDNSGDSNAARTFLVESLDGKWIKIPGKKTSLRYRIKSGKEPYQIFIGGLGSSIEREILKNKNLKNNSGVIFIEMEGQGASEVMSQSYSRSEGPIVFQKNIQQTANAIKDILKNEKMDLSQISFSGHSFGGLSILGIMKELGIGGKISLFATGVTNLSNRFLSTSANWHLNNLSTMANSFSWWKPISDGDEIALRKTREFLLQVLPALEADPSKLNAATRLTVGAGTVDAVDIVKNIPHSEIQIISGELDNFVFPMLHYELAQAAMQAGHNVQVIMVEGVGHYLTNEMTKKQIDALERLKASGKIGYFYITKKGNIKERSEEMTLKNYQEISRRMFENLEPELIDVFDTTGYRPQYPETW